MDSAQAIKAGLSAYDSALLVVSYHETFLDTIASSRWIEMKCVATVMQAVAPWRATHYAPERFHIPYRLCHPVGHDLDGGMPYFIFPL